MALLQRANRRFFLRHPLQLALAILGIAIGVAAAVAVDLSVSSARAAFQASMQALLGSTTHHLVGSRPGIDERLYPVLRREFPEVAMRPIVEGIVETAGETLRLTGFDVFAGSVEDRGRSYAGVLPVLPDLLLKPDGVLMSKVSARQTGTVPGQTLPLKADGRARTVQVLGTIEGDSPAAPALEGVLLADIAAAQELLGKVETLDRIDLILPHEETIERRLVEWLPPDVQLVAAEGRTRETGRLSSAFETNLRAMSLLGLVVGLFLIYNTMTFSVLQRRELIASLRLLGVTRTEILREILGEALMLGMLGSAAGLLLGVGAAEFLVDRVTRTINDVYFVLTVKHLFITPSVLVQGFLLGLLTSIAGAWLPAREAAGTLPLSARSRSQLEEGSRRLAIRASLLGTLTLALSFPMLFGFSPGLVRAIGGLFLLLAGCGLLIPALVALMALPMKRLGSSIFRLAIANVSESLSRTGMAIAALAIAFAVALGVEVMTDSFRVTVEEWLQQLMQSDLYVAVGETNGRGLDPEAIRQVAAVPGVAGVSAARRAFVESPLGQVDLVGFQPGDSAQPGYRIKDGNPSRVWSRFFTDDVVLISEPFASRHGVQTGDTLRLATAQGAVNFPVVGVVYDYRSDRGIVLMRRALYVKHWRDERLSSIGVVLAPGAASDRVRNALKSALGEGQGVQIRSNAEIRDASLAVFDRTFAVTGVLRLLAAGVALVGLVGSLLALHLERLREFATLRALGLTPGQLTAVVLLQSSYIGLCAGVIAVPLGLLLAWVLVESIQLLSFGWSMDMAIPDGALWRTPVIACVAAVIAGVFPAWRAGRSTPLSVLREE
jgi:putative ABC transport system permease protein